MTEWRYTIDIKPYLGLNSRTFDTECENSRDAIVSLLRRCRDYQTSPLLRLLTEEMEACDDLGWFNCILNDLYDWADENKVWMGL